MVTAAQQKALDALGPAPTPNAAPTFDPKESNPNIQDYTTTGPYPENVIYWSSGPSDVYQDPAATAVTPVYGSQYTSTVFQPKLNAYNAQRDAILNGGNGTAKSSALDAGQQSALAILKGVLAQYGLDSLSDWAQQAIVNGESSDQILLELRDQPAFHDRFPAIFDRQAKGLPPISPTDYVAYEQTASQLLQQYGLPNGMANDKTIVRDLLAADVSPTELRDRLDQGFSAVANGPQTVQDAFARYYGVQGKAALAAMYLDPTRAEPELLRMSHIAGIGGEGADYGQSVSKDIASRIEDAGISSYQRHSDFLQANAWKPLENQTLGEANSGQTAQTDTSLQSAAFGLDSMSQLAVTNLLRQRNAAVQNIGSGSVTDSAGAVGLGASQPVG